MENILSKVLFVPQKPDHKVPVKSLTFVSKDTPPTFTYSNINSPIPNNNVLIKVSAAAINPVDLQLLNSPLSIAAPGVKGIGRDFSGVIEEVGTNQTKNWAVGDRVCGMYLHIAGQGTIASHVCLNPNTDRIIKIPPNLTTQEAASFPLSFGTAYRSLGYAKLDSNSWVCVLGGSTAAGQYAIQLARNHYNVAHIVTSCSAKNETFVKELGADVVIDYKMERSVGEALVELTNNAHVDYTTTDNGQNRSHPKFRLIIDCVGGTDVLFKATQLLEPKSTGSAYVTLVGDAKTDSQKLGGPGAYLYNPAMIGRKFMSATGISGVNYIVESVAPGDWLEKAYDMFLERTVRVTMDSIYDWSEWPDAFDKLESRKVRGKVVLEITT